MTLLTIAVVYVVGGLTFIPLLLAAILIPAWYLLPPATNDKRQLETNGLQPPESSDKKPASDGAASGTFAVLREYSFHAANTALNSRSSHNVNAQNGMDGEGEVAAPSESVYQSMYRSVFDRGKNASGSNVVLEKDTPPSSSARTKKNAVPVNVFHIVLRHGHLMLYDSAAQVEVKHVISLANHTISLSQGEPPELDEEMKDAELFIKRTAIVLTPIEHPNGALQPRATSAKPFYLFSNTCFDKEDFYHALLYTRKSPPIPITIDSADAIKLQSALYSTSLTPETKAMNALIGRIFLGLYRTDRVKDIFQKKIEKKISRVQKPAFIASLSVHNIDLGDACPVFSNLKLKDFSIDGDMTMSLDVRYDGGMRSADGLQKQNGGIKLTISALAKLDLGPRFKTRTVDLLLATSLQRLSGRMLVRVKPPPSNRIWFCFESMPEMDIKVEPVVSQRQITYTFVLRAIEDRIRAVVGETLVKPNWDDVAFFDTRGQAVRGGIWQDEGIESLKDDDGSRIETLKSKHQKTMSMPSLARDSDSSGTSSGSEAAAKMATSSSLAFHDFATDLKRRSVASLPLKSSIPDFAPSASPSPHRTRPLRSPSFTSATPSIASVAMDDATAEQVRSQDFAAPPPRLWRMKAPQLKKEAMDAMREVRDRAHRTDSSASHQTPADVPVESSGLRRSFEQTPERDESFERRQSDPPSPSSKSMSAFAAGTLRTPNRANTKSSVASGSSSMGTTSQQQRKNILAATAAATNAARTWSWNAIANARNARPGSQSSAHSQSSNAEPIGRGQPLPPPGMPLPGPQKGSIFGNLGSASIKRKPVLPERKSTAGSDGSAQDVGDEANKPADVSGTITIDASNVTESPVDGEGAGEFGPWNENSGPVEEQALPTHVTQAVKPIELDIEEHLAPSEVASESTPSSEIALTKKIPPPLPKRRASKASAESALPRDAPAKKAPPPLPSRRSSGIAVALAGPAPSLSEIVSQENPTQHSHETSGDRSASVAHYDVKYDEPTEEELELPNDDDEDAVVAVPAPVEDDVEEESEVQQSESVFADGEAEGEAQMTGIDHAETIA